MKIRFLLLPVLLLITFAYGDCPSKCGTFQTNSCSAPKEFTANNGDIVVTDKVRYYVSTSCCGGGNGECCRKDYIKISGLTPG